MLKASKPLILRTDHLSPPDPEKSLWENRADAYRVYDDPGIPLCSIAVTAYNRVDKTKTCVECVLRYTRDIDFELLLIDNGSTDGTLEYFESVPYAKKKIVRITKNIGFGQAWLAAKGSFSGKYLVVVANDVYVTENWLTNLLTCYESDPDIGFVAPVSSNVSNYQQVDLPYSDFAGMQELAASYNSGNPLLWEERLRCISLIGVYSRAVLDIVGLNDSAFIHDFIEDDLAMRLRRSGFKLILCRDTWVCHDHAFNNMSQEVVDEYNTRLSYGRAAFKRKYRGLDAWDDILNFEHVLLSPFDTHPFGQDALKILAVDCRCGTPILESRNRMKRRGLPKPEIHALTTHARYYEDLATVADSVTCAPAMSAGDVYQPEEFDIVVACEELGSYSDASAIRELFRGLVKRGGVFLYKEQSAEDGVVYAHYEVK